MQNKKFFTGINYNRNEWEECPKILTFLEFGIDETYRSLKFGNNIDIYDQLHPVWDGSVPIHGIVLFHGSINNLPRGFQICDGTNGTPDLRQIFIKGATSNQSLGKRGGSYTISINLTQMPAHNHPFTPLNHSHSINEHSHNYENGIATSYGTSHIHAPTGVSEYEGKTKTISAWNGVCEMMAEGYRNVGYFSTKSSGNHTHNINTSKSLLNNNTYGLSSYTNTIGANILKTGQNREYSNEPLYYELLFIMKMVEC